MCGLLRPPMLPLRLVSLGSACLTSTTFPARVQVSDKLLCECAAQCVLCELHCYGADVQHRSDLQASTARSSDAHDIERGKHT